VVATGNQASKISNRKVNSKKLNTNPNRITAFRTFLWAVVLVCGLAHRAGASLYGITFNDGQGDSGSGQIDVQQANNNYYASSGYLTVDSGGAAGNWTLYSAGGYTSYPGYLTSPAGAYRYNNAVYPDGNPQYPSANTLLDLYGLLFTQSNGNELNLWGNADDTYTLGGNVNGWQNFNVVITFGGTTIAPVPEASTRLAVAFLLVVIGASEVRALRKKSAFAAGSTV
jgi:hypothetical protein